MQQDSPAPSTKERPRSWLRRQLMLRPVVLLRLALFYLVLCAVVFALQRRLLYHPDRYGLEAAHGWARAQGLTMWPASGAAHRGFLGGDAAATRGTIVVAHGNAGTALARLYYVEALTPLGFRVLLAEYPGYGARAGELDEETLVADLRETVRMLAREELGPIYLWGESLGCGVAAAAARDSTLPVAGVVMLTPWDSLPDLAQSIYWFLPARWLVRDRYDSVENLASFPGPVAVVMAEEDEVIPNARTLALYRSLPDPKRLWRFPGAGHNTWPASPGLAWWGEVTSFVAGDGGTAGQ